MAKQVKLKVDQGSTYEHTFQYREADETTVIPLTSYTAEMQIREFIDDAAPVWTGTTAGGELTIDEPNGEVTLEIPDTDSDLWTFTEAVYDLEIISPASKRTRLVEGRVFLNPQVTR